MSDITSDREKFRRHRGPISRYIDRFDDGEIIKWAFRGLLVGAIIVLALDVRSLVRERSMPAEEAAREIVYLEPALRPNAPGLPAAPGDAVPPGLELDETSMRAPMRFELQQGGLLAAEGSIDVGAAARFAQEVERRGEYVKAIALNSPGGSLDDAMAMARLVRERGFATLVEDGSICASSCPLLLAGGVARRVGAEAGIGLHQFYAVADFPSEPRQAMADAQATTARISRHLTDMGVDPAIWLHALDTPPNALYYLSGEELRKYRLVTTASEIAEQR